MECWEVNTLNDSEPNVMWFQFFLARDLHSFSKAEISEHLMKPSEFNTLMACLTHTWLLKAGETDLSTSGISIWICNRCSSICFMTSVEETHPVKPKFKTYHTRAIWSVTNLHKDAEGSWGKDVVVLGLVVPSTLPVCRMHQLCIWVLVGNN